MNKKTKLILLTSQPGIKRGKKRKKRKRKRPKKRVPLSKNNESTGRRQRRGQNAKKDGKAVFTVGFKKASVVGALSI